MRRLGYVATAHRADDPTLTFNLITEVICLQNNRNERGVLGGVLGLDRRGRDNNVKIPRVIEKKTSDSTDIANYLTRLMRIFGNFLWLEINDDWTRISIFHDKSNIKEYVRSPDVNWVITLHILGYTIQWAMDFLQTFLQNKHFCIVKFKGNP